jgi:hypothetical protein
MVGPAATGKLETLLTSNRSFVNGDLTPLYGLPASGADLHPAVLDPAQRAGILTQASFLAGHSDALTTAPARRGQAVLQQVLCIDIAPPANLPIPPPPAPDPAGTNRRRFEALLSGPCASACHMVYDLGFAFENYSALGVYRTSEPGGTIDASGRFVLATQGSGQSSNIDLPFQDAVSLMRGLAAREEVAACMPRQWFRFLSRRREEQRDEPSLSQVTARFRKTSYDMREILLGLVRSPAFTHRTPNEGEVLP